MPDLVRRFFVSCAQIFEAYVVRTVMKLGATGGKSATKAGAGKTPRGHEGLREDIQTKERKVFRPSPLYTDFILLFTGSFLQYSTSFRK